MKRSLFVLALLVAGLPVLAATQVAAQQSVAQCIDQCKKTTSGVQQCIDQCRAKAKK